MKRLGKFAVLAVVISLLATASIVSAGGPDRQSPSPRDGLTGTVTEISDDSMTVETVDGTEVIVDVSGAEVQIFATGETGSLSDIEVGSQVRVLGAEDEVGAIVAEVVTLLPDGDLVSGRVTDIDDATITVETRDGESVTIVTTRDTVFRTGQDDASLSDVEIGQSLQAHGTLESDGSLTATVVLAQGGQPGGPGDTVGPIGQPGEPGGGPGGQPGGAGGVGDAGSVPGGSRGGMGGAQGGRG